ncbi:gastrula zinc finger protein XlCGF8.2DB-like X2 [Biomphalaria pfeifferi]|uniref:Gastrula zinc finger protein XlCGF8.2DB-like X2 n=1 Tax=Biomphalaria pfeifferi TaxID=112525 RepID=A0AAD8B9Q4_BIOPF|nr:gastrula zinc finger protein XlCGF8.2DB-like X2 [Biomphalaria pfeifferi]
MPAFYGRPSSEFDSRREMNYCAGEQRSFTLVTKNKLYGELPDLERTAQIISDLGLVICTPPACCSFTKKKISIRGQTFKSGDDGEFIEISETIRHCDANERTYPRNDR